MFGAPAGALGAAGQNGVESCVVRPILGSFRLSVILVPLSSGIEQAWRTPM
jgi:hypothetical protein